MSEPLSWDEIQALRELRDESERMQLAANDLIAHVAGVTKERDELRARAERAEFLLREVVHEDCWLAIVPQIREFLGDAPDAGGGE